MRLADDPGEEARCLPGQFRVQPVDLNLEVLRKQFAEENRLFRKMASHHSIAQMGRKVTRAFHDAHGVVFRHLLAGVTGCRGSHQPAAIACVSLVVGGIRHSI